MNLPINETDLLLVGGLILNAAYQNADKGFGSLVLQRTYAETHDSNQIVLQLDPWSPEGFKIEHWTDGKALVICGSNQIVMIDLANLRTQAAIPLEYEECETLGQPWFAYGNDVLVIATESRVFSL